MSTRPVFFFADVGPHMNMAADGPREGRWRETKSPAQDAGLFLWKNVQSGYHVVRLLIDEDYFFQAIECVQSHAAVVQSRIGMWEG
jgi:hypothetical protein